MIDALIAGRLYGSLTQKVFQAKDGEYRAGLDMVAQAVLTAYHVKRKRAAVSGENAD